MIGVPLAANLNDLLPRHAARSPRGILIRQQSAVVFDDGPRENDSTWIVGPRRENDRVLRDGAVRQDRDEREAKAEGGRGKGE